MEQADLLRRAVEVLESQQVPYLVVGSFASMAYGEPRLTRDIDVVVDRIVVRPDLGNRLADSIETALELAEGLAVAENADTGERTVFSARFACPVSGFTIEEIRDLLVALDVLNGPGSTEGGRAAARAVVDRTRATAQERVAELKAATVRAEAFTSRLGQLRTDAAPLPVQARDDRGTTT